MAEAGPPVPQPPATPGRAIARKDFERVIRRAAELALSDADASEDAVSEDEVLRIATELGLSPMHVKHALAELPELTVEQRWYDPYFGSPLLSASRLVPGRAPGMARRIEDYLVTKEYLQIVRRRPEALAFTPADDTISSLARAFLKPQSRHVISRSSRVMVGVHPMPDDTSHVRFDIDLSDARHESVRNSIITGSIVGTGVGSILAAVAIVTLDAIGPGVGVLAFGSGLAGSMAGVVSIAASGFKRRVATAKHEVSSLLDRLEQGDRLEPPPAPWRRQLQNKLFGSDR
jgi:hypothetical protein